MKTPEFADADEPPPAPATRGADPRALSAARAPWPPEQPGPFRPLENPPPKNRLTDDGPAGASVNTSVYAFIAVVASFTGAALVEYNHLPLWAPFAILAAVVAVGARQCSRPPPMSCGWPMRCGWCPNSMTIA